MERGNNYSIFSHFHLPAVLLVEMEGFPSVPHGKGLWELYGIGKYASLVTQRGLSARRFIQSKQKNKGQIRCISQLLGGKDATCQVPQGNTLSHANGQSTKMQIGLFLNQNHISLDSWRQYHAISYNHSCSYWTGNSEHKKEFWINLFGYYYPGIKMFH